MGVEYRHFVIPATCGLIPSPARVCNLIQKMVENGWLPGWEFDLETPGEIREVREALDEDQFVALMAGEFRANWKLEYPSPANLRYPFTASEQAPAYCTVQICHSQQYLIPLSELIDPLADPVPAGHDESRAGSLLSKVKGIFSPRVELLDLVIRCDCGAPLEDRSELFVDYNVLLSRCARCGKPFSPEQRRGKLRSGWGSAINRRPGGLAHRFGLVFDCGKCLPRHDGPGTLEPELMDLISNCTGGTLFDFPDLY